MFRGDMAEQRRKLMQMLTAAVKGFDPAIIVPMLEGAAVHTAIVAKQFSEET
jgi:hypothetical protein